MQHVEGGPDCPPVTFGPGYPAPMRIPLRKGSLAKAALMMAGIVALGVVTVLYFWPLAWHPVKRTPLGGMLVVYIVIAGSATIMVGLYYLVFGAIWAAKDQTGVFLDAEGYTDSTMLAQVGTVRILWRNIRSITAKTNAQWPPETYVCVDLTDSSVYLSYSFFKRFMASNRIYKKRNRYIFFGPMQPGLPYGLLGNRDVILARALSVDAQYLASLMNSYLFAWRKEHGYTPEMEMGVAAYPHFPPARTNRGRWRARKGR